MFDDMVCDDSFCMTLSHQKQILINRLSKYKIAIGCVSHTESFELLRAIAKMLSIWAKKRHDQETIDELKWADLL
jgi:hypothetical protein